MADEVVVRELDDGRLLVVLTGPVARDLGDAVKVVEASFRDGSSVLRGATRLLAERLLSADRPVGGPRHAVLPSSSVEQLLVAGSLDSVSIDEAALLLGLGRSRVYELRAAGVLRPAGPGRVLMVDVELLQGARGCA